MSLVLITVGCGILAAIFKTYVRPETGDALMASLIFVPAILFVVEKNGLADIGGFGLTAKFAAVTSGTATGALSGSASDYVVQSLVENDADFAQASYFEACTDYFVLRPSKIPAFGTPQMDQHVARAATAIRSSLACGRLAGVIVLDDDQRYLGTYDASFFAESLSIWAVSDDPSKATAKELAERIERYTIFGAALKSPAQRIVPGEGYAGAINAGATLRQGFDRFQNQRGDNLVLTDEMGRYQGLLRRSGIERAVSRAVVSALDQTGGRR